MNVVFEVRQNFILAALLFLSGGLNFYLALRKADLIVVDKTSRRTLAINNKDYGQTKAVSLTPDNLTSRDKKALVSEFLRCLYEVNGAMRPANVNRLLKMMEPNLSLQQAQLFNNEKLLAQEKAEGVNSSWELQDVTFDERDPYIVRALGVRRVRRVRAGGGSVEEETQIEIKFLLMDSPTAPARNENNCRTGFYVLKYRAAPDVRQNAHRCVLNYNLAEVAAARRAADTPVVAGANQISKKEIR